jgi:type II secretory pathway component PulJ
MFSRRFSDMRARSGFLLGEKPQGAVLIDVLISLGLISILAVFLLSVLLNARNIDRVLTDSLAAYHQTNRVFELLKSDLSHSRAIIVAGRDEGADGRSSSLMLLQEHEPDGTRGPVIEYHWVDEFSTLMRTVLLRDGRIGEEGLPVEHPVEFEILMAESQDDGGSGLGLRIPAAEGVVMRMASKSQEQESSSGGIQEIVQQATTSHEPGLAEATGKALHFPFPVPVAVIAAEDLRP